MLPTDRPQYATKAGNPRPPDRICQQAIGAKANSGWIDTENQAKVASLMDLWAPRYADAKSAHQLLSSSVAQAKDYSEAYFASQQERIDKLASNTRNCDRLHTRMASRLDERGQYRQREPQADSIIEPSPALLREKQNVNQALRFGEDADGYEAMMKDAIALDEVIQDLAADLTGFEDSDMALMDNPDAPAPAANQTGDNSRSRHATSPTGH